MSELKFFVNEGEFADIVQRAIDELGVRHDFDPSVSFGESLMVLTKAVFDDWVLALKEVIKNEHEHRQENSAEFEDSEEIVKFIAAIASLL